MMSWVDYVSIAGTAGTLWFGYVSLKQKSEIASLKQAIKASMQSTYNAWWYVGVQAEKLLKCHDSAAANGPASEINGVSHTARSTVIALSREYTDAVPFYEPALEPRESPKRPS
jgi:hypothetical protein